MKPLQEILARIRWDKEFGAAEFELGYYDRIEDVIIRVALSSASLGDDSFGLADEEGSAVTIPFHRVRQVWRNGELIWNR